MQKDEVREECYSLFRKALQYDEKGASRQRENWQKKSRKAKRNEKQESSNMRGVGKLKEEKSTKVKTSELGQEKKKARFKLHAIQLA